MIDRDTTVPKHEQLKFQKENASEHAAKCVAAECWKPGSTDSTFKHALDAHNTSSFEKLAALGFPKTDIAADSKNLAHNTDKFDKQEHSLSSRDKIKPEHHASNELSKAAVHGHSYERKGHDVVENDAKGPVKSADHQVHRSHHEKHHTTHNTASSDNHKQNASDAVEKFTGTDGKLHTYTDYNVSKFMPKPSNG